MWIYITSRCLYIILYLYTHTCPSVCIEIHIDTPTDTYTLPHYISKDTLTHLHHMGSSHFTFNVFILNPILTLSSEHYSWQCGIFSVPSGWEAARPRAWGPPWVPGMRDQCWWQCPPGSGEHGTGQLSAVNEKTKWWGNTLGISNCCHCTGGWIVPISNGQTLLLHSVYCCI